VIKKLRAIFGEINMDWKNELRKTPFFSRKPKQPKMLQNEQENINRVKITAANKIKGYLEKEGKLSIKVVDSGTFLGNMRIRGEGTGYAIVDMLDSIYGDSDFVFSNLAPALEQMGFTVQRHGNELLQVMK